MCNILNIQCLCIARCSWLEHYLFCFTFGVALDFKIALVRILYPNFPPQINHLMGNHMWWKGEKFPAFCGSQFLCHTNHGAMDNALFQENLRNVMIFLLSKCTYISLFLSILICIGWFQNGGFDFKPCLWMLLWLIPSILITSTKYSSRQRAVFTGGTLRQKKSGQRTMSRRRQCQRLLSSLGWRCRMVARQGNRTRIRSSPMSFTRSTRFSPGRRWRRERVMKMVGIMIIMMKTCSLGRSCVYEAVMYDMSYYLCFVPFHQGNDLVVFLNFGR